MAEPAPTPTVTRVDKTTTTTTSTPATEKKTTTSGPEPSKRSEGIFLAMFGAGFVLLLAGSFYDRIQSITGPGGVGIVLKAVGKDAADGIAALETALKKEHDRIDHVERRIAVLEKGQIALGTAVPPSEFAAVQEELAAVRAEAEDVAKAGEELPSPEDDFAAVREARQRLLARLDLL